ncbi:hypothetical protein CA267_009685 [Alteromonas pelagimontana]|uniref:DUF4340 domain-containing protein n=1 Tax=Alteromonas pelagimontana TaxID=1858656 RepID=A0A6M4MDD3_9ALTE|nr:hypothetical protein [Alteromonas pelagimontana]QJR81027.1 hypothetical protein CA267_009685 [Alteromonas pelagimontana]
MARLSQRAMNNVVIFAMLLMIALFNIDAFLPAAKEPAVRPLLMQDDYVLKIEQGDNRLERVGQQWRQTATLPSLPVSPEDQLLAWQKAILVPTAVETATSPYVVVVWLAGNANGNVFAFYPTDEKVLVKHDDQWFTLKPSSLLYTMLPWNPELATYE